jgi:two-component system cell cycle response regulator DivK
MVGPATVLVVEDNPQNLELVEFLLEDAGMTVVSATDAESLWTRLDEGLPDLVLMDMQLPGRDGLDLVAEIRSRFPQITAPVVALTAHAMRGDRERFLAGGCDGYIAKPIDAGGFADQVRQYLGPAGRAK